MMNGDLTTCRSATGQDYVPDRFGQGIATETMNHSRSYLPGSAMAGAAATTPAVVKQCEPDTPADRSRQLMQSNLPRIQLPGDNRLVSDFALELGSVMAECGLYRRNRQPVFVDEQHCRIVSLTPECLRTWVEQHCLCYRIKQLHGQTVQLAHTCSFDDAKTVIQSQQFLKPLPEIVGTNSPRLPVMRSDGSVELLSPGYDRASRIYTLDSVQYDEGMRIEDAQETINEIFSEFPFQDARSRSVAIAAMLSVYCNNMFPLGLQRPAFIFMANCEGSGKTLLAKLVLAPTHGIPDVKSCSEDSAEMRKELFTSALEGRPFILLDNVKGRLNSAPLEAFLTASRTTGRILGKNHEASTDLACHVIITGNAVTVSPDMRRRSLFVELFTEYERPEDRPIKHWMDDSILCSLRPKLLSALWSMVRHWGESGKPLPSNCCNSFRPWAGMIAGMVECAGYESATSEPQLTNGGDNELDDMRGLVAAMADAAEEEFTFDQLMNLAKEQGLFEWVLNGTEERRRSENARIGRLFSKYDRRVFRGRIRFLVQGQGRNRRYLAVKEQPPCTGEHARYASSEFFE